MACSFQIRKATRDPYGAPRIAARNDVAGQDKNSVGSSLLRRQPEEMTAGATDCALLPTDEQQPWASSPHVRSTSASLARDAGSTHTRPMSPPPRARSRLLPAARRWSATPGWEPDTRRGDHPGRSPSALAGRSDPFRLPIATRDPELTFGTGWKGNEERDVSIGEKGGVGNRRAW